MLFGNCICNCFCFVSLFVLHSLTVKSLLVITNTAVPYIAVPLPSSDVESLNGVYTTIHVQHTCLLQPACRAQHGACMFFSACVQHVR